MRKVLNILTVFCLLLMTSPTKADESKTPDWPEIHGGQAHAGCYPFEVAPPYKILWSAPTINDGMGNVVGCWDNGIPKVIYNSNDSIRCTSADEHKQYWQCNKPDDVFFESGIIAVGSSGKKYYVYISYSKKVRENKFVKINCVDMDGKTVWTDDAQGNLILGGFSASDGYLYVPTTYIKNNSMEKGILHKIKVDDGKGAWSVFIPDTPVNCVPTKIDDRIYLTTQPAYVYNYADFDYSRGGHILAIDDNNGNVMKDLKYDGLVAGMTPVFDSNSLIIAGKFFKESTITEIDPKTGDPVTKKIKIPHNFIQGLELKSLHQLWELNPPNVDDDLGFSFNTPVVSKDWIIVGSSNNRIYAFNRKDKTKNWSVEAKSRNQLSMAITDNYLHYFDGNIYKTLDLKTQEVLSQAKFRTPGMGCVSLFDKYIFVMTESDYTDATIYCITKGLEAKLAVESHEIDLGEICTEDNKDFSFNVWNEGDQELPIKVKASESYVSISSDEMILGHSKERIDYYIQVWQLKPDNDYKIIFTITSPLGFNETVTVKFRVVKPPVLACYPKSITFQPSLYVDCMEYTILVKNIGNQDRSLKCSFGPSEQWCAHEPMQWETKTETAVTIKIDSSKLDPRLRHRQSLSIYTKSSLERIEITVLPWQPYTGSGAH